MISECPVCGEPFLRKSVCPMNEKYGGRVFHTKESVFIKNDGEYLMTTKPCHLSHPQWTKINYKDFNMEKLI